MADQYSSDEDVDDLEYTTTTTLLGYAETTPPDDTTSHLGGIPSWLDNTMDSRLAKCLSCNNLMPLLLQLDGNIPESPQHTRMLYLFGCRAKACRKKPGSIRAIRGVKSNVALKPESKEEPKETPKEELKLKSNMGDLIFGSSSSSTPTNPFATSQVNPFATSQANPFAKPNPAAADDVAALTKTFASVASISAPPQPTKQPVLIGPPSPWPSLFEIPQYPSFYLDASYEELEPDTLTLQAQKLARSIKMDTDDMDEDNRNNTSRKASSSKTNKLSKETEFESTMNATFLHFQTIASQNPEQVLRYERRGTPLLYSRDDTIGKLLAKGSEISMSRLPRCSNCSRERCYELQLMPHAISVLEEGSNAALDEGMVWGTIIVATCEVDCAIEGCEKGAYVEEWVGVQWETD